MTNGFRKAAASAALVFVCGCGGGGSATTTSPTPAPATAAPGTPTAPTTTATALDTTPPSLSVPFVPTEAAVAFFVFGVTLPSGVQNPTYEVETANQSTAVFAASGGKVVNITTTSQGDRAVFVVPSDTSIFDIAYDHVNNVQVAVGQTVTAGQQIGTVGTLNNGRGRTELQINRKEPAPTVALCPSGLGTASFNDAFRALAQRLNGSPTVCSVETVRP